MGHEEYLAEVARRFQARRFDVGHDLSVGEYRVELHARLSRSVGGFPSFDDHFLICPLPYVDMDQLRQYSDECWRYTWSSYSKILRSFSFLLPCIRCFPVAVVAGVDEEVVDRLRAQQVRTDMELSVLYHWLCPVICDRVSGSISYPLDPPLNMWGDSASSGYREAQKTIEELLQI